MAGVLSVSVLPCLPVPAAWCRSRTQVRRISSIKLSSHGLSTNYSCTRAARSRRAVMPVRADGSLSELTPTVAAVYGSLLLGGGLFAYTRSSSKGSLLGGLSGGALMGLVRILSPLS
ncbi:hypothetical protein GOP47_0019039 [Adiantum capillus-veneris]|uniref:Uncharacterized protein n=1 Tax=Adiantum capillus-veneris TaxID=13818 RepID=A0A9D4ZA88_ADICA|nr:hypothetical protein GOP47_0019039 [Adiantum capillus-veneris]